MHEVGVASAAVALASSDGLWTPAYATDTAAAGLEQEAFILGEGPCYDALQRHAPVLVADLTAYPDRNRWPMWSSAAQSVGIRAVAAFPIQAGVIAAGVLTLFSDKINAMRGARLALAVRFADIALLGVLDVLAGLDGASSNVETERDSDNRVRDLADVVRAEVHQAAGMVMAQAGIPIEQALARLRAYAFQTGRSITDVAADVLARRMRFRADEDSAQ